LNRFKEAYTTERWIVRIYEVQPEPVLDPAMTSRFSLGAATSYPEGKKKLSRPEL
jgi:hypothetical protein